MNFRSRRIAALLAFVALGSGAIASMPGWAQAIGGAAAQSLPSGARVEQPLSRGPSGEIELIDPTKQTGKAPHRCSPGAICVGKGQAHQTLADALAVARPGMTVELMGGTYRETVAVQAANLTIRGVAGTPRIDCTGLKLTADKACILLAADGITLENLDISGAVLSDAIGANGACVRNEPNLNFRLRRIVCHGSQDGVLTNGGNILIENSEFYDNGWTGQTHNVYLSGRCGEAIVRGSTFRDARVGHEFKSRCRRNEISNSVFRSTHGSRNLDIPDGGDTMVYRSLLEKTRGAESQAIVGFAAESCAYPGDMILKEVTIVNSLHGAVMQNFDKCPGKAIVLEGVKLEGLPIRHFGYVLRR